MASLLGNDLAPGRKVEDGRPVPGAGGRTALLGFRAPDISHLPRESDSGLTLGPPRCLEPPRSALQRGSSTLRPPPWTPMGFF